MPSPSRHRIVNVTVIERLRIFLVALALVTAFLRFDEVVQGVDVIKKSDLVVGLVLVVAVLGQVRIHWRWLTRLHDFVLVGSVAYGFLLPLQESGERQEPARAFVDFCLAIVLASRAAAITQGPRAAGRVAEHQVHHRAQRWTPLALAITLIAALAAAAITSSQYSGLAQIVTGMALNFGLMAIIGLGRTYRWRYDRRVGTSTAAAVIQSAQRDSPAGAVPANLDVTYKWGFAWLTAPGERRRRLWRHREPVCQSALATPTTVPTWRIRCVLLQAGALAPTIDEILALAEQHDVELEQLRNRAAFWTGIVFAYAVFCVIVGVVVSLIAD